MRMPWKKSPAKKAVKSLKKSLVEQLESQLVAGFSIPSVDISQQVSQAVVTIFGGTKVNVVKADPKEEKDDQDAIYNEMMSAVHGDRDIVHPVDPNIEIKAFSNDSLTPEEREDVYKIIDIINEAADINRDGKYRDDPQPSVPEEEPQQQPQSSVNNALMALFQPTLQILSTICSYLLAIVVISKVGTILDKV